jgi:hypothetical protein
VTEGVGELGTTVGVPTVVGDPVTAPVSVAMGVIVRVMLAGGVWMVSAVPVVINVADGVAVPAASIVGLEVAEGMTGIMVLVGNSASGVAVGASSAVGVEIGAKTIS